MALSSGTKLGPYEIVEPLGAGGMGEVYKARDTRLERTVAVKVLPSHLSADPERKQRFEREARAISSLQHPHICTLHDVGSQDGVDFLVMEHLEGETLAERLKKGALPTEQVLKIGMEVADALDKAHRQGVVHRDLKPGNIMLTKSGSKLLDFGLAKPAGTTLASGTLAQALTAPSPVSPLSPTTPLTQQGTIVGTFQYMSPEQVEGKEADPRTDIFALGAVLYEMATGKRAFEGKSQLSVASAILERDPEPISRVQPLAPAALEHVVGTCLAKDPEDRWQSAADVRRQLKWISEGGSSVAAPAVRGAKRKTRERLAWSVAALLLVGFALAATGYLMRAPQPRRAVRVSMMAPPDAAFQPFDFALSPDGSKLAFVAVGTGGAPLLWVRPLDSLSGQPLAGTEGAGYPFWSPDSRQIGFFAGGKLKRIEASGGTVQIITEATDPRGGAWNPEGVILFTPTTDDPLYRVNASGGAATPLTNLVPQGDSTHRWPQFLPDGRHFIYLVRTGSGATGGAKKGEESGNGIYLGSLDSPDHRTLLVSSEHRAMYAAGHLLFVRTGNLMAQRFDPRKLQLAGDPVPVAAQVPVDARWTAAYSASDDGKLVFQSGGVGALALTWYDRAGKPGAVVATDSFNVARLSPDGRKVAASVTDSNSGTLDLWIYDLARGVKTRLTFDPGQDDDPVWSPDGSTMVFDSTRTGTYDLYQKPANGAHPEELLYEDKAIKYATSWSSDGKYVLFDRRDPQGKTRSDLWVLPMFGERKPFPFLETQFDEHIGEFSPDGKWVAYVSNESGREEVYAVAFPKPGGRFQISVRGGNNPKWRADGRELLYLDADSKLMAVPIAARGDSLEIGTAQPLFQPRIGAREYSLVSVGDGKRFLVIENPQITASSLTLVLNWDSALKQ